MNTCTQAENLSVCWQCSLNENTKINESNAREDALKQTKDLEGAGQWGGGCKTPQTPDQSWPANVKMVSSHPSNGKRLW